MTRWMFMLMICTAAAPPMGESRGAAPATQPAHTTTAPATLQTITGTDECASCEGLTTSEDDVALIEKDGTCWLIIGSGPGYVAAQDGHNLGKSMTTTLAGEPVTKIGVNGKSYKEVHVTNIVISK